MTIPRRDPLPALVEFIRHWVPALTPSHGIPEHELPDFLPPPLRIIYGLAGNYPEPQTQRSAFQPWLFGHQDHLLPIYELRPASDRLTFLMENQNVWTAETLLGPEDPPVFSNDLSDEDPPQMREVCPSLSHFLTTFCLQELALGSYDAIGVEPPPGDDPAAYCFGATKPLWLDGLYVSGAPTHSFYLCEGEVLILSLPGCDCWWLALRNAAALRQVRPEFVPGAKPAKPDEPWLATLKRWLRGGLGE